jgi:hypothetical protein
MGTKDSSPGCQIVPKSVYVKIYASTLRYHQLMKLAKKRGCSWHTIALEAIDYYLANPPKGRIV